MGDGAESETSQVFQPSLVSPGGGRGCQIRGTGALTTLPGTFTGQDGTE